jgi:hypothetical protein
VPYSYLTGLKRHAAAALENPLKAHYVGSEVRSELMQKVFEIYTRKAAFLSRGTSFEAIYVPPDGYPDNFDPQEWDFRGRAFPPKSATVAELAKKTPIYRHGPAGIDARALWPNP